MARDKFGYDPDEDYTAVDNPFYDNTVAAHPAFWRGQDDAFKAMCKKVNDVLDGAELHGTAQEPWESTRRRIRKLIDDYKYKGKTMKLKLNKETLKNLTSEDTANKDKDGSCCAGCQGSKCQGCVG